MGVPETILICLALVGVAAWVAWTQWRSYQAEKTATTERSEMLVLLSDTLKSTQEQLIKATTKPAQRFIPLNEMRPGDPATLRAIEQAQREKQDEATQ